MTGFGRWALFFSIFFAGAVAIFVVWTGGFTENLMKLIVSASILLATLAVVSLIARPITPAGKNEKAGADQ